MRYRFNDLEIDSDSFAIHRGGASVEVEPRVLEFLLYLIEHRKRMVPKHELLQQVWRGSVVGDSVLTRCACIARQILGDRCAIRTIHGRGYQWLAVGDYDDASKRGARVAALSPGSNRSDIDGGSPAQTTRK
jgi:DNA-binding winged helix-turn-helix (wHTH) protein